MKKKIVKIKIKKAKKTKPVVYKERVKNLSQKMIDNFLQRLEEIKY